MGSTGILRRYLYFPLAVPLTGTAVDQGLEVGRITEGVHFNGNLALVRIKLCTDQSPRASCASPRGVSVSRFRMISLRAKGKARVVSTNRIVIAAISSISMKALSEN